MTFIHTVVRITTKLSNGIEVSSVKGDQKWGWDYDKTTWKYLDETVIFDEDGGPGEWHTDGVGTFDAHDSVVATLEYSTGAKRLEKNQTTTVYYDHECDTVSQEGK